MNKKFVIATLSDQASYDPNNVDVRTFNNSWKTQTDKIPGVYLAWLQTYYQYKTPVTNFVGKEYQFGELSFAQNLYKEFPKLINADNDFLIKGVLNSIAPDSAEGRQNKFVLLKDHYVCRFIVRYFVELGGTLDASNKANTAKFLQAKKDAEGNYNYWLKAREASLKAAPGWITKYLKPALIVASLVAGVAFPGAAVYGISLAGALTQLNIAVDNFKETPQGWETTFNGKTFSSDGEATGGNSTSGGANILKMLLPLGLIMLVKK